MISLKTVTVVAFIALTSCKKEAEEPTGTSNASTLKTNDVSLSRKTDYGNDWIYYSFNQESEISGLDEVSSKTTDSWDIAFNRFNVRTNSGLSGNGLGGVYDAGKIDFTLITEANVSGYTVDDTLQITESFNGQGVDYMTSNGNDVFKGCVIMEFGAQGPSYSTNEHVYIVKTAKGKYVKLMITSYYNSGGISGYISFKYTYQSGEGLKFE